jgi:hypothetical protein
MRHRLGITLGCLCLALGAAPASPAKEGLGLTPLRSTRLDVIQVLGYPSSDGSYYTPEGRVRLLMGFQPCEPRPRGGRDKVWESRNLVLAISLELSEPIPTDEIDFDWGKFLVRTDVVKEISYYQDEDEGVAYQVAGGKVIGITYEATKKDHREYSEKRGRCRRSS